MNLKNKWLITGGFSAVILAALPMLEGNSYKPYDDIAHVLTVCRGHTGKDIIRTKLYTEAECVALDKKDLAAHAAAVYRCTNVTLSQNQFDAMVLFTYNVGETAYCRSSLLKKLNAGDYVGACNGLLAWSYAGGKYVHGLRNRREFERKLCLKGST